MWKIIDNLPDANIGYRAILDEQGNVICHPSPMGESNARLIAAATDLLAALRALLPYAENEAYSLQDLADSEIAIAESESAWKAIEIAQFAIAKAEGI